MSVILQSCGITCIWQDALGGCRPNLSCSIHVHDALPRLILATGCHTHSLINHIHIIDVHNSPFLMVNPFTRQI